MSPPDLPKVWILQWKKNGKIGVKLSQSKYYNFFSALWFNQFPTLKNDFENQKFEMFEEVVHSFGKSDGDIIREKMLIFTRCIGGFMSNSNKNLWQYLLTTCHQKLATKVEKNCDICHKGTLFFLYHKTFLCHILESPITFVGYWKKKGKNNLTLENEGLKKVMW